MWTSNQCEVMDLTVVCHGNCLETPGPPKFPQAAAMGLCTVLFKGLPKPPQNITNNGRFFLFPPGY